MNSLSIICAEIIKPSSSIVETAILDNLVSEIWGEDKTTQGTGARREEPSNFARQIIKDGVSTIELEGLAISAQIIEGLFTVYQK